MDLEVTLYDSNFHSIRNCYFPTHVSAIELELFISKCVKNLLLLHCIIFQYSTTQVSFITSL